MIREEKTDRNKLSRPGSTSRGWHSRGYLPHFDAESVTQSITFRLHDSLPAEVVGGIIADITHLSKSDAEPELRARMEDYLDKGSGSALLKNQEAARIVENSLLHFDGQRYFLHSWAVMPNHVHALVTPAAGYNIPDIIHSLKSFTALACNQTLGRNGNFWQREYYDRFIRNREHFNAAKEYIEMNPVKAGLCVNKEDWQFSSASKKHSHEN